MFKNKQVRIYLLRGLIPILILGILIFPWVSWALGNSMPLNAVILDKTVPDDSYREHKGLMWILNNYKYVNKATGKPFLYSQDYYGFVPLKNDQYDIWELPKGLDQKLDLIYFTDTYGVYTKDYYQGNLRGDRSELIYGGTTQKEIQWLKDNSQNSTVIAEFNTIAMPTSENVRKEMESFFGIRWKEWIGRYFTDLSRNNTEIPTWLVQDYEKQYQHSWDFKGAGFAFVKSDNTVVILRKGTEVGKNLNQIVWTKNAGREFHVENNVKYYYWFEITEASPESEVLANYVLDVNQAGEEMLQKFGLPKEFPAVIRKKLNNTSYYFAGDFADNDKTPVIWNAYGIAFRKRMTTFEAEGDQDYFYWNVYEPLITNILDEIKNR